MSYFRYRLRRVRSLNSRRKTELSGREHEGASAISDGWNSAPIMVIGARAKVEKLNSLSDVSLSRSSSARACAFVGKEGRSFPCSHICHDSFSQGEGASSCCLLSCGARRVTAYVNNMLKTEHLFVFLQTICLHVVKAGFSAVASAWEEAHLSVFILQLRCNVSYCRPL